MSRKTWESEFKKIKLRSNWRKSSDDKTKEDKLDYLHNLVSSLSGKAITSSKEIRLWKSICSFIRSHPKEVCDPNGKVDRRGRTCLHAICAKRPPARVIKAYISEMRRISPKIKETSGTEILESKDYHGRTPLAICVAHNAEISAIQDILEACPDSAKIFDNKGYSPLHLVCSNKYSDITLVKRILDAYPDATRTNPFQQQLTPLHLAIENFASIDVVKLLIDVAPDVLSMSQGGNTPLELAIRVNSHIDIIRCLIENNIQSVSKRISERGDFPLHLALQCCPSFETITLLCLNSDPEVFEFTDSIGRTMLHRYLELNRYSFAVVRSLLHMSPQLARKKNIAGTTPLDTIYKRITQLLTRKSTNTQLMQVWDALVLILSAYLYNNVDEGITSVLHASLQTDVPLEVVQYILSKYPDQVKELDASKNNSLPVSLLLRGPASNKGQIMNLLLARYPEAAQMSDTSGRCLLHYAAKDSILETDALKKIYSLAPHTLSIPDPDTRLYPFMLAAIKKDERKEQSITNNKILNRVTQERNDLLQMNMVLELLSAFPETVAYH